MRKNIPLVNLTKMHDFLSTKINLEINKIINSNNFLNHKIINRLENKFAKLNQSKYCVAVSNGTSALSLALEASGIGVGHDVITTTNSFFSTYESIIHVGARPIVIDVNENDLTLDANLIEKYITKKTKAIIPVHIYGKPVDMNKIIKISKKYKLLIIEDCAQSHFAKFNKKFVGNFSLASAYSFYPGKNIGGFGDAGCVVTNNKKVYQKIKSLRDQGRVDKYKHQYVGYNYRIDAIQAAVIHLKLNYIFKWNKHRRDLARIYTQELKKVNDLILFDYTNENIENVFHLFVVSVKKNNLRNSLIDFLKINGISAGIHYPIPIHLQPPVLKKLKRDSFPVMNYYKDKILSLPICPFTSKSDVKYVTSKIIKFFNIKS